MRFYPVPHTILQYPLYYRHDGGWLKAPSWVDFFLRVGEAAAVSTEAGRRLVLCLSLPSRRYAAPLVTCGLVSARSALPEGYVSSTLQFERVCSLSKGTPLCVLQEHRELRGIFVERREVGGTPYVAVKIESKSEILIPPPGAWRLRLLETGTVRIPKRQSGRLVSALSPFARHFIGGGQQKIYAGQSQLECAVVGRLNALRREAVETEFAVSKDGKQFDEGTLQDVLRLREFTGVAGYYRSALFRLGRHSPPQLPAGQALPFVVFDGAAGFCRWRDRLGDANWVVLLDRTDATFQDGASVLNQAYMKSDDEDRVGVAPPPPPGVEVMSFYERLS